MAKPNYNTQTILRVQPSLDKMAADNITTLGKSYGFDRVFGGNSTQDQIFRGVASILVDRLIQGRNATLLVYGHPLSGKTYTLGSGVMDGVANPEGEGLIPRASDALFNRLHRQHHGSPRPSSSFSSSIRSSSPSRLRPVSMVGLPGRRGSTPNLSSKTPQYTIHITFTRFEHGGDAISLLHGGEITVRNTGDVLRNLDVAAEAAAKCSRSSASWSHTVFSIRLRQEKWTQKPPATVEKKESVVPPSKRRISTLNVKAMVGQMEKQARQDIDDDNGEWVTTESQLQFVEMGPGAGDSIQSCLCDLAAVIACVSSTRYPRSTNEQFMKHASRVPQVPLEQWVHEWSALPTLSPSTSTIMSDVSDDDVRCRSTDSARTTLTIPEITDLERQIEELQNQVAVTQARNKHTEQELRHKGVVSTEREQAVSMYMGALERRLNSLAAAMDGGRLRSELVAIDQMLEQLRTCIVSDETPPPPPAAAATDASNEQVLQREVDALEKQLAKIEQKHHDVIQQLTADLQQKAAAELALHVAQHSAQMDELKQQHNAFSECVHSSLDQRKAENKRLQQQLEQLLAVEEAQGALIERLTAQTTQHSQSADMLKQQLDANEACMAALQQDNREKAQQLDEAQATIDGLVRHIASLSKEKHELDLFVRYVDSSLCRQNNHAVQIDEQLLVLKHAHTQEVQTLAEEKRMLQQQIAGLVERQQKTTATTDSDNEDKEQQHEDDEDDTAAGEIRNIILGLEARLQTLQQTKRQDEDEFDLRFERAVEDLERTQQENKQQSKTIASLEEALGTASIEQQRLMDKVAQLAQENAQLTSQMTNDLDNKHSSKEQDPSSPRGSLMSTASLPPPTAPPSNPLPPIPTALPPLPASPSSRPQSPIARAQSPPPMRSLLQRQNSGTTATISELLDESNPSTSTAERYERIIQSLRSKMQGAEQDIKAHQDVIGKLELQLSRSEHTVRDVKRQLEVLSREKQTSTLEIQNLRTQVSAQQDAAKAAGDIKTLEDALDHERQLKEKAEKARHILESRMEELMSKKSKFMCF